MKIDILKYLVCTFIIHSLLAYFPDKKLSNFNVISLTLVLITSFFFLNNYYSIKEKFDDTIKTFINNQKKNNINLEKITKSNLNNNEQNSDIKNENSNLNSNIHSSDIKNEISNKNIERFDENNINIGKPEIFKELINKKLLSQKNVEDLIVMCSDKDKCLSKVNSFLNEKIIDNRQLVEMKILFGLDNLSSIQELYLQERLDRENAFQVANAIKSNSKPILISTLNNLVSNNIITREDADIILNKSIIEDNFSDGVVVLSNLVEDGRMKAYDAKIIHEKCSSTSLDSCSIFLNKLKNNNIINEAEATSILQAYNRPGINSFYDFDNSLNNVSYRKGADQSELQGLSKGDMENKDFSQKLIDDDLEKQSLKPFSSLSFDDNDMERQITEKDIDNYKKSNNINKDFYVNTMENDNYVEIQDIDISNTAKLQHDDDMRYSKYSTKDYEYLGTFNNDFTNSFSHGSTYLKTNKWRPQEYDTTKCKIEEKCELCEEDLDNLVNVNDFSKSRKILPNDNINIDYINDKLNSGLG